MGRPPGPAFRFTATEVAEMEACLRETDYALPPREIISSLAEKFSLSVDRQGKTVVQSKQVWNWFQNRRYAQRAKSGKASGKLSVMPMPRNDSLPVRSAPPPPPVANQSGKSASDGNQMEFEAKSARDGAWYDVTTFISHRLFETGDPEVLVRFSGFSAEEDEWVNVRRGVRQRSLPCETVECVVVLPGDLVLCFQEGREQALYFDAHVLDVQRRRHDVRGCRCRFLVRYDHDQSEEIVALRKICRRPETDNRLQQLHASKDFATLMSTPKDPSVVGSSNFNLAPQKSQKQLKVEGTLEETPSGSTLLPCTSEPANTATMVTMAENTPTMATMVENKIAIPDLPPC